MSTPTAPAAPAAPAAANLAGNSPANSTNAPNPPAAAPERMLKVKVEGKEVELPESEVLYGYQNGKASSQRYHEAAKLRREAEQIMANAKENPAEFLQKTGMSPRQWAEQYLLEQLTIESMSPEQKRARENEEKLKKFEKSDAERKDAEKKAADAQLEREHMERYDQLFVKALTESGLPKTRFTIMRMATLQKINLKNGLDLSASQLAKVVREDYVADKKALLEGLDGDQLIEFLGPELVKKLSKAQIAKLKARGIQPPEASAKRAGAPKEAGLTWDEWRKRNRGR